MTNNLTTHAFQNHQIRVVEIEGNPWFLGADLLRVLYGHAAGLSHSIRRPLREDEIRKVSRRHLGMSPGKDVLLVAESGLYKLALRSDKPEARQFQDWVTREVLPSIRKNGEYLLNEEARETAAGQGELPPVRRGRLCHRLGHL